jgi:hypothetical protein
MSKVDSIFRLSNFDVLIYAISKLDFLFYAPWFGVHKVKMEHIHSIDQNLEFHKFTSLFAN